MKTKSMHKGLALVLAVLMMLALIPLTPFTTKASAAGTTHVLNASELPNFNNKGDIPEGKTFEVDNGYFTIYCGKEARFDKNEKTFDDGFAGTQRINFNGGIDTAAPAKCVGFKTSGAATVKVWWAKGDADRQVVIMDSNGKQVAISDFGGAKNEWTISTLKVPAAGSYFLGGTPKTNYLFKIEVTEEAAAAAKEYVLDTTADVKAAAQGTYKDGDSYKAGTDSFFTVYNSAKTKNDSSEKTFDDGYKGTQRINFGGAADTATPKNVISFKADGAGTVKLWWVSNGNDRLMTLFDSTGKALESAPGIEKNALAISDFKIPAAGTYYVGSTVNGGYIFKLAVTTGGAPVERADWSKVAAPVIAGVTQAKDEEGKLTDSLQVTVKAVVGNDGGDAVKVLMTDKDGKEVATAQSLRETDTHPILVPATQSGTYTLKATLVREGEKDKESAAATGEFKLTLKAPTIASATNKGNGKVLVKWDKVDEATGYVVYAAGKEIKATTNSATVEGLKVGDKVEFTVAAVRGSETGEKSKGLTATITAKEQQEWGFTAYGTSASNKDKNTYSGNINEGSVTVIAQGNAGKFNRTADNGYSFYYTAVPANKNFTLRAKVHIDEWSYTNGQEGFGIAAVDSLPEKAYDTSHWTNFYMSLVTRYDYDGFKSRMGVGVHSNTGITPENWQAVKDNSFDRTTLYGGVEPLDTTGKDKNFSGAKYYNIAGNCATKDALTKADIKTIEERTDFDLEITKNNTGFFCSYYKDGKLVKTVKHWGTDDLTVLDKDYIYVGIVAARNCTVTVKNSDLKLTLRDPKDDPKAEPKPIEYVTPSLTIESGVNANSEKFNVTLKPNYKGNVVLKVNGAVVNDKLVVGDKLDSDGNVMETIVPVTLKEGKNTIEAAYTVDSSVKLEENQAFSKKDVKASTTVVYDTYFAKQDNLYVAPGATKGNGSKESPIDIYTAVKVARPGQKIILTEGTYKLPYEVRVTRGMDGTKDKMIYMIADPEAKTRPVLDFEGTPAIGLHIVGDYWYLQGFDVTHAGNNGVRIDSNNCVVDQVKAYENHGTGISIQTDQKYSRLLWPMNNTIKNCDAYYNSDPGEGDADGFSAKFAVGVGNVFDNCVAYNNSDDGWDLYGRAYPIEPVTIKNSVTYKNGYRKDGSRGKGDGNGFKLGGDNNAAAHLLINSLSFLNGAAGITCNSSPNVIVKNSTSYKNDGVGITLYTKASQTNFESAGVISYKNGGSDSFEPKGSQDVKKVDQTYWNGANGVADDWFKSLNFGGAVKRNADGSINMEGFLELTDKAPKNAGAILSGVASANVNVTPDKEVPAEKELDDPAPATGFVPFAVVAVVLAGAGLAVCALKRKKSV